MTAFSASWGLAGPVSVQKGGPFRPGWYFPHSRDPFTSSGGVTWSPYANGHRNDTFPAGRHLPQEVGGDKEERRMELPEGNVPLNTLLWRSLGTYLVSYMRKGKVFFFFLLFPSGDTFPPGQGRICPICSVEQSENASFLLLLGNRLFFWSDRQSFGPYLCLLPPK